MSSSKARLSWETAQTHALPRIKLAAFWRICKGDTVFTHGHRLEFLFLLSCVNHTSPLKSTTLRFEIFPECQRCVRNCRLNNLPSTIPVNNARLLSYTKLQTFLVQAVAFCGEVFSRIYIYIYIPRGFKITRNLYHTEILYYTEILESTID